MKTRFKIEGMHCASCARTIEKDLGKTSGVTKATVNYAMSNAAVEHDEHVVSEHALHKVVEKAGYKVSMQNMNMSHEDMNREDHLKHGSKPKKAAMKAGFSLVLAAVTFALAMFWPSLPFAGLIEGILATIVVVLPGSEFHIMTLKLLKRGRANMDTLISMGTLSALVFSWWQFTIGGALYFETAALIIALILLGRYFEATSKGKAGEAIAKLLELGAKTAHLLEADGSVREIAVDALKIGDKVLVKPGEKVPLDGVISDGSSHLDESMLTGESVPVMKKTGDKIFGATMNVDGALTVTISKDAGHSLLAKIVELVQQAQETKAPIEKLADQVSSIFVPSVIVIAALTFGVWLLLGATLSTAFLYAVAVLVIACPCALGLATPTAILVGTGRGAKEGILIKSGEALERARGITTVVFDKTGTLTEGKPTVTDIVALEGDEKSVLKFAASVEFASEHPLARAIIDRAKQDKIELAKVMDFKSTVGHGVEGVVEGKKIAVGAVSMTSPLPVMNEVDHLRDEAKTVVEVTVDGKPVGLLAIADAPKEHAKAAIEKLVAEGFEVIMLTGDHTVTAEAIGKMLGLTNVIAEVLPQDKLAEVKKMQQAGKRIVFVGDGINDAPALTQADLGIAVGTGSDIAIEAGQMVLIGGGPEKVVTALKLTRDTYRIIKQNLFWAFFYNVIAIPVAAFGLLNPIVSSFAMAFSSVSVVFNSLRLRK